MVNRQLTKIHLNNYHTIKLTLFTAHITMLTESRQHMKYTAAEGAETTLLGGAETES